MKYVILFVLLAGCLESSKSPEGALKDFVQLRLEKTAEKSEILARLTGKLKLSLEAMDEKDFSKFADLQKYKRDSFRIISKSCQEKKCYVTYALTYRTSAENNTSWKSEVKKIAELQFEDGKWLIADVSNIKTYHESADVIEVTP